jgi:hypothetical protein
VRLAEVGELRDPGIPSHPLLVPIEHIAPGVPEDDDLIQEGALVRGGGRRLSPSEELVANGTAGERGRAGGLYIPLLIGLEEEFEEAAAVRVLPGEPTGGTDVLTEILFQGIKDLFGLHRAS